jgi:type 1 glutamine amidotransferase
MIPRGASGVRKRPLRVLAITGGHRYDEAAFDAMMNDLCEVHDWVWALARQPDAQKWLRADHAGVWDVILLHDIAGLRLKRGTEPVPVGPEPDQARQLVQLLEAGQPLVVLHHAVSSWPAWDGWAEIVGARFHYRPGVLRGVRRRGSGYRHAAVPIQVVDAEHPIAAGLQDFELDDELYHFDVLSDVVHPVLRSTADFDGRLFTYTYDEVRQGSPSGATCEEDGPGPDLVAWTTVAGRSPVGVIQPGDGPATFADASFRRLLANSLGWAASPDAHEHAMTHARRIDPAVQVHEGVTQ